MPIYEYYCADCCQRVSVFFRSMRAADDEAHTAACPHCGHGNLTRLMSRATRLRSEEQRLEELASPELMSGLAQEDPQALAAFMRGMNDELGDPRDDEMEEAVERWQADAPPSPAVDNKAVDIKAEADAGAEAPSS
jgi:putative FmdB family regulatory protein